MARSLTVTLAVFSSGVLDKAGSEAAFSAAFDKYQAESETEDATIADAVNAQFDKYPGASQNMPALIHGALTILNVQPAAHGTMEAKVHAYISENSDRAEKRDRKTKAVTQAAEPKRTRLFGIKKGVGGGVCRWSDVPEAEG